MNKEVMKQALTELDEIIDWHRVERVMLRSQELRSIATIANRLRQALALPDAPCSGELIKMVDAAMIEMKNLHPPLKRSECARLIKAALAQTTLMSCGWTTSSAITNTRKAG